jgi:hypothetical protein
MKELFTFRYELFELTVYTGKWNFPSRYISWNYWHLYIPFFKVLIHFCKLPF